MEILKVILQKSYSNELQQTGRKTESYVKTHKFVSHLRQFVRFCAILLSNDLLVAATLLQNAHKNTAEIGAPRGANHAGAGALVKTGKQNTA